MCAQVRDIPGWEQQLARLTNGQNIPTIRRISVLSIAVGAQPINFSGRAIAVFRIWSSQCAQGGLRSLMRLSLASHDAFACTVNAAPTGVRGQTDITISTTIVVNTERICLT